MSGADTHVDRLPPQLGQHTAEILKECGFEDAMIEKWIAEGGPCHPLIPST
jgi:crotonobetainyl-CoA:carnitine CoA-transferase CaiB-like acyl-CoA transferase